MNMQDIISESLWLPVRKYNEIFQAFWPIILFEALTLVYIYIAPEQASLFSRLVNVGVVIVFICLYISAAVNWHRMLLLDKPLANVKFIPSKREFNYFIKLIITNIFLIGILVILLLPIFLFISMGTLPEMVKTNVLVQVVLNFVILILLSVAVYGLATVYMSLPASTIDATSIQWPQRVSERFAWGKESRKAIAKVFFYSSLPGMLITIIVTLTSKIPFLGKVIEVPGSLLSILTGLYWMLAFATVLSLTYKEHVLPDLIEEAQKQSQETEGREI